ncbi:MAG: hypothetical protein CHACPFDD_03750 [Phycisphaerae bacterium]|nr:hypothetical protein [Phycisphaerae bacterium]
MADANALPLPPPEPGPQPRRRFASLAPLSALLALFALAAAVRAWLAFDPSLGHESDLSFFSSWTRQLTQHGLSGFHEAEDFCDYPPLMLLLFRTIGALVAWLNGGSLHEHTLRVALKLPACLADLALGLLIAREAARCAGRRSALPAAALYLLNPLTIYNSAYWGQVDSIYALFAFAALAAAGGTRWVVAGFLIATALLTKFQAVAFLPLIILEAYRRQRWIGVGRGMIGAALAAALILAPFIAAGALRETLRRSYVHVIGQYNDLTRSAYNLWTLAGPPQAADTAIPAPLVRLVAGDADSIADDASWLLRLNWRTISLTIFSLAVAIILALYSLRPTAFQRHAAAGALGLAFFLLPTEMHERYALPAAAFLAVWAMSGPWAERTYVLLSAALLLNVAAILPPKPIAPQIAAANLALFAALLLALSVRPRPQADAPGAPAELPPAPSPPAAPQTPREPVLLPLFRWATLLALAASIAFSIWLTIRITRLPPPHPASTDVYLSALNPVSARQGWRTLAPDYSVSGGLIHLGGRLYLRGLGTHAPSHLVYEIPAGCAEFRATVGIDAATRGRGSAAISVVVDGNLAVREVRLDGRSDPLELAIPLNGARRIELIADPTPDGRRSDHVSWALARFIRNRQP